MAETTEGIEQQVEHLILARFAQEPGDEQDSTTPDDSEERRVIDVDLYHLEGGAVLLVPHTGTNPLEAHSVESVAPTLPQEQETPGTDPPTPPSVEDEPEDVPQAVQPEPAATGTKRRVARSGILLPLLLLCLLSAGIASDVLLVPLLASATVTITPKAKSLHTDATLIIAAHPKAGQVQGRPLQASSITQSVTVPVTGHGHDDATSAGGIPHLLQRRQPGVHHPRGDKLSGARSDGCHGYHRHRSSGRPTYVGDGLRIRPCHSSGQHGKPRSPRH